MLVLHMKENWELINSVDVLGRPYLPRHLLLPGFGLEFPFRLAYESASFNIRNIKTGTSDLLIETSAKNDNLHEGASFFIEQEDGGLQFHFCSTFMNQDRIIEYSWHFMDFGQDFTELLKKHGRLPPQLSLSQYMT